MQGKDRLLARICAAGLAVITFPLAAGVGWLVWTAAVGGTAPAAPGPGFVIGGAALVYAILVATAPNARLRNALWFAGGAVAAAAFMLAPQSIGNFSAAFRGDAVPGEANPLSSPGPASAALTGFVVATGHAALVTVAATLAGYVCSRAAFRGRSMFLIGLFAVQAFPTMALLAPQFLVLHRVNLIDAPAGAILALSALELPFAILFMKAAFDRTPAELELSALADGASRVEAFRDAALPLAAPAAIAVGVLSFMVGWGDYVLAQIVFVSQERWTFSMYVHRLADENLGVDYGALAALALAYAAPPLLCLALAQRAVARSGGWARLFE